ncbi:hypothetical protein Tco_1525085 [Tanacetum coccineum]
MLKHNKITIWFKHARRIVTVQATTSMGSCRTTLHERKVMFTKRSTEVKPHGDPMLLWTKDEKLLMWYVTPKTSHLNAVKRIFKYLKGKPHLGLWYPRKLPFDLEAFSNSDYGGSNLDRKSTTGGCQFLGQRLISWQCKKQAIVATSTTEVEYVAAANCCGQLIVKILLYLVLSKDNEVDSLETDLKQTKLTMGSAIVKNIGSVRKSQDDPLVTLYMAASLAEAIRLDTLQKEEEAKQVHLDSLLAQRLAEEEELSEQQKKRRAQVQFEAQHYTDEDWDLIRAKIEANAELSKSMLGSDLQGEDFAKKMVDLVNQRKKYFAEERARAKRNKPMTQSQLRTYMMNYLKNQGTWKLSQLKNLSFEEVKEEFDKLVKHVESFAPINFEATKDSLKRFGEELQTKTSKRLKSDEAKDDEPAKKSGKRRKQMTRKGLHTDLDKDVFKDSDEVSEQDDSVSGTKIPVNPDPVAMKSPSIATYKIIKQREKDVYQIIREDGTDIVYINFGAMLKDISRDDLTELYRIVMNRYGMDGPEDELEKVLWEYLKNMFEEPLSTDPIWSVLGQQRIISWRYYDTCRVHCLNLESMDIYMLIERKYPLSAEICKAMLDKKLQGGKPDEDCYKMLKMMEKQAGIRK